jgi:hypothetical protein
LIHEGYKRYAHSFPFDFQNIRISILFIDKKTQEFYPPPCIASAHADEGEFIYGICPDPEGPLQTVGEETHVKALSFLK